MNEIAEQIGNCVMVATGMFGVAALLGVAGLAINKALWFFVESSGGIGVFKEFAKWSKSNQANSTKDDQ